MFIIVQIVAFIIAIGILVTVHEFGHFWVARRLQFTVLRFSIGFGKPLWQRVGRDGVEYVIGRWPLGGYVKLVDEREGPVAPEHLPGAFTQRPIWARILVLLAGPGANFLFAFVAFWMLFMQGVPGLKAVVGEVIPGSIAARAGLLTGDQILAVGGEVTASREDAMLALLSAVVADGRTSLRVQRAAGERLLPLEVPAEQRRALTEPGAFSAGIGFEFTRPHIPVVVGQVVPGGAAAAAGLKTGDLILAIDAIPVTEFLDFRNKISSLPNKTVRLTLRRAQLTLERQLAIRGEPDPNLPGHPVVGRIGIGAGGVVAYPASVQLIERYGPVGAVKPALRELWSKSVMTLKFLGHMVVGEVSLKNVSGPIGIAAYAGASALAGGVAFLGFLAVISLSLGILNLLPVPVLDGGQVVYQLAEALVGRPLPVSVQIVGQQIGYALLVLLMVLAFYNDIARHFG
jgi:regulator of sigma E protease